MSKPMKGFHGEPISRAQQATVSVFKSVRATDDARMMSWVVELLQAEMRPSTISKLTGLPSALVVRLHDREVMRSATGRTKSSLGQFIELPQGHVDVSRFVIEYALAYEADGRTVTARGYLQAWRAYRASARSSRLLDPEAAYRLCEEYHAGQWTVQSCPVDGNPFAVNKEAMRIGHTFGYAECPHCRSLRTTNVDRTVLMPIELERSRRDFEHLLKTGKARV